eukprot:scaffold22013_cov32-Phaeocystis_antarctica.AAC.1
MPALAAPVLAAPPAAASRPTPIAHLRTCRTEARSRCAVRITLARSPPGAYSMSTQMAGAGA